MTRRSNDGEGSWERLNRWAGLHYVLINELSIIGNLFSRIKVNKL